MFVIKHIKRTADKFNPEETIVKNSDDSFKEFTTKEEAEEYILDLYDESDNSEHIVEEVRNIKMEERVEDAKLAMKSNKLKRTLLESKDLVEDYSNEYILDADNIGRCIELASEIEEFVQYFKL